MSFYVGTSQIPTSNYAFNTTLGEKCFTEFNEFLKEAQRIGVHDLRNLVEKALATSYSKEEGFDSKLAEMIFLCGLSNKVVTMQSFWLDVLGMEISIKVKGELFFHALRHRDYLVTSTLATTLYLQGALFSHVNSDDLILLKDFIIQFWHHCKEMDKDISIEEQVKLLKIFLFTSEIISPSVDTEGMILSSCWKSLNWKEGMPTEILGIIAQDRVNKIFDDQYMPTQAVQDEFKSLMDCDPYGFASPKFKATDLRIILQQKVLDSVPSNQKTLNLSEVRRYELLLTMLFIKGDIEQIVLFLHHTENQRDTKLAFKHLLSSNDPLLSTTRDQLLLKSPLLLSYFKLSVGINPQYGQCLALLIAAFQILTFYTTSQFEVKEVDRYNELIFYLFDILLTHPNEDLQDDNNFSMALQILNILSKLTFEPFAKKGSEIRLTVLRDYFNRLLKKGFAFGLRVFRQYYLTRPLELLLAMCSQINLKEDVIDCLNDLLQSVFDDKKNFPHECFLILLTIKRNPSYQTYKSLLNHPEEVKSLLIDCPLEEEIKKIVHEFKSSLVHIKNDSAFTRDRTFDVFFNSLWNFFYFDFIELMKAFRFFLVDEDFPCLARWFEDRSKIDLKGIIKVVDQLIQSPERSTLSLENQQRLLDLHWKLIAQQNSLSSILNLELQKTFVVRLPKGSRTSQEHVERLQGFLRTEIGKLYSQMNSSQFKIFLSLLRYLWSYQSVELDKYLLFVALNSIFKSTLISSESMRRLQLLANVFLDFYEKDASNQGEKEEMKVLITECLKLTASWMELVKIDSSQKKTTKDKTKGIQTQFKETSKELSKLNVQIFDSSILHRSHVKIQSSKLIVAFHLAIGSNGWDLLEKSLKKAQEEETKKNQSLKVEPKLVKSSQSNLKTSKKDPSVASSSSVKKQVASSRKSKTFDSKEKLKSSSSSIDHHADQILPDVNLPLSLSSFEPEKIKELSLKDKLENLLQKIDKDLDRELLANLCKEIVLILSEFERDKKDEAYQALAEKLSKVRKVSLKAVKIITEEIKEWTAEDFDELLYQIGIVSCSCRTMELIVQVIGNPIKKKRLNDLWAFKVSEEVKNQRKQLERRGTLATIVPPSHQASSSRASGKDMQRRNSHQSLQRKSSQQHLMAESSSPKSRSRSGSFAGDGVGITFPTNNVITTYASEIQEMPSNLKDLEYKLVTLATDQKFLWQITTDAGSGHRKCTLICQLTGQDYGSLPISISGGKAAENVIEDIYRQQFAWIHHCAALRKKKAEILLQVE